MWLFVFSKHTSRACVCVCVLTFEQPGWQLHRGAELGDSGQSHRQPHLGHAGVWRRVWRRGDAAHHRHLQSLVPLRGYVQRTPTCFGGRGLMGWVLQEWREHLIFNTVWKSQGTATVTDVAVEIVVVRERLPDLHCDVIARNRFKGDEKVANLTFCLQPPAIINTSHQFPAGACCFVGVSVPFVTSWQSSWQLFYMSFEDNHGVFQ